TPISPKAHKPEGPYARRPVGPVGRGPVWTRAPEAVAGQRRYRTRFFWQKAERPRYCERSGRSICRRAAPPKLAKVCHATPTASGKHGPVRGRLLVRGE